MKRHLVEFARVISNSRCALFIDMPNRLVSLPPRRLLIHSNQMMQQTKEFPSTPCTANNYHRMIYTNSSSQFSIKCGHRLSSNFSKSEYIHPLSQIVLEHLQSSHADWVQRMGLDKGLELKKDGTFVLRFDSHERCGDGVDEDNVESIW